MTKATLQDMVDRRRRLTEDIAARRAAQSRAPLEVETRAMFPNDQPAEVVRLAVVHVRREVGLILEALDAIDAEVAPRVEEAPGRGRLGPNQSEGPSAERRRRGPAPS